MTLSSVRDTVERLGALATRFHDRDALLTWKMSDAEIRALALAAEALQGMHAAGVSTRVFDTGLGLSIFRDKSTRTRYSFRSGCNLLGLATEELEESSSQLAHGETVRETAAMISFLSEVVGVRDDMFVGLGHAYMAEVAAAIDESYRAGVLAQRPSVINLQCDLDHPTQALADLRHLASTVGGLDRLRGKKLAMTWAYSPSYGKPLSVPQGVVALMTRFGMDVTLAHPPGYQLLDEPLAAARGFAAESGGSFTITDSMDDAFRDADFVYPKSWAPLHVMEERTRIVRAGERARLAELEREALAHNARFKAWECTADKMRLTRGGDALYLHCLPADVTGVSCQEGEVAKDVFEKHRLATYREAGHKPFVIAAMVLLTRFAEPAAVLRARLDEGVPRRRG